MQQLATATAAEKLLRAQISELTSEAAQQSAKFAALQATADKAPLESQVWHAPLSKVEYESSQIAALQQQVKAGKAELDAQIAKTNTLLADTSKATLESQVCRAHACGVR